MSILKFMFYDLNPFHKPKFKVGDKIIDKEENPFKTDEDKLYRIVLEVSLNKKKYKLSTKSGIEFNHKVSYVDAVYSKIGEK